MKNGFPTLSKIWSGNRSAYIGLGIRNTGNGSADGYIFPETIDEVANHLTSEGITEIRMGYNLPAGDVSRLGERNIVVHPRNYCVLGW